MDKEKVGEFFSILRALFYRSERHSSGIDIHGNSFFKKEMMGILDQIMSLSQKYYNLVINNIDFIAQASRSSVSPDISPVCCRIKFSDVKESKIRVMGSLISAASRVNIYKEYQKTHEGKVPRDVWASESVSEYCWNFAYEAVVEMGLKLED